MPRPTLLCELHDYIEIACTFRIPIALSMASGKELTGIAVDTMVKPDKTEHLIFIKEGTDEPISLIMNDLIQMRALIENVHFEIVDFK